MPLRKPYQTNALHPRPVALLELLAAAAGAGIVATDARVRVWRGPRVGRRWAFRRQRASARFGTDESIGRRFAGAHGRRLPGRAAKRRRDRLPRPGGRRRADLDLQLEPALGERAAQVVHQADEHLVGLLLVLDERVILAASPDLDPDALLFEVVEMVLPLFVEDADHDLRQRLIADVGDPHLPLDLLEVGELALERRAASLLGGAHQIGAVLDHGRIRDARDRKQEALQVLRVDQPAVPFAGILGRAGLLVGQLLDRGVDHAQRLGFQLLASLERELAERVDHVALLVHHVVELEQPLARLKVLQLDALLRLADGAGYPRVGDDLAFLGAGAVHPARDPIGPEQAHQVVFQREEEHALAGVALAPRTTAQLAVDAPRLVALGADDHEPARRVLVAVELLDFFGGQVGLLVHLPERGLAVLDAAHLALLDPGAEFDVGAPPGHVGGDRDGARLARLRDDLRLALVVLGVQHLVLQAAPLQHARQRLRDVHAHGADQHRQPLLVLPLGLLDDGVVLLPPRLVDEVVLVHAAHRPVGGDHHDFELVDLVEFGLFGLGGARHARQLFVPPGVGLDGDGRGMLAFLAHRPTLLRLHRLVQSVRPAPAGHQPAGELVHDENLAVPDHVIP